MKIFYNIDFSQREQKYVHILMDIELQDYNKEFLELIMPVWSPGSYLVREYSRHLDCFTSKDNKFEKITKNKWKINLNKEQKILSLSYRLYCNELTVRTNFIDDIHCLLVSPATFLITDDTSLCNYFEVKLNLPENWDKVTTGLDTVPEKEYTYYSTNLDDFLDCPIEVGTYEVFNFEAFGKPHEVAMIGPKVYEEKTLVEDIKKVVEATGKLIEDIPYKKYFFITHLTNNSTGGIEHKNSTVLHFTKWDFQNPEKYKRTWLSLVSHEYFHLWNIKRLKPIELANFDYNKENYTTLLWFAEGFTSYFDDFILKKAGIYSDDEYLEVLSEAISRLLTVPGRFYQSMEEASFDAWIKYYRKHENTNNQGISYYAKGAHFALCLDFEIRKRTNSEKSLTDLLKMLWSDYVKDNQAGFTREIIKAYAEELAGDLTEIFTEFLDEKMEIDYNKYFIHAGLKLKLVDQAKPSLGMEVNTSLVCTEIKDKGSAYYAGLMTDDEIIAIDGYRVNYTTFQKRMKYLKVGSKIKLLISRSERILEKELEVAGSKNDIIKIERIHNPTQEQINLYTNWLKEFQ